MPVGHRCERTVHVNPGHKSALILIKMKPTSTPKPPFSTAEKQLICEIKNRHVHQVVETRRKLFGGQEVGTCYPGLVTSKARKERLGVRERT